MWVTALPRASQAVARPSRVPGLVGARALTAPPALRGLFPDSSSHHAPPTRSWRGPAVSSGLHSSAFGLESWRVSPGGQASCSGPHSPLSAHFPSAGSSLGTQISCPCPSHNSKAPLSPSLTLFPSSGGLRALGLNLLGSDAHSRFLPFLLHFLESPGVRVRISHRPHG